MYSINCKNFSISWGVSTSMFEKKCVICGTSIIQMLTNREKYIIHLKKCAYYTFLYLLRFSLVTSLLFTTYTVLNSIFMYNYMYNYNYIANEEL